MPTSGNRDEAFTVSRIDPVRELARRMRRRELTSRQLVERCLARIDAVDGLVHAWVSVHAESALAEADQCDREAAEGKWRGPLHGIPLAVKDIIDLEGWPTRAGSRTRADAGPAAVDAPVVTAARAAGAVVLGKTHTTEFACYEREAPFRGAPPTRNPHALANSPGGSSSGSAAAVAAGMVPLALGSQTGGSLTRPASFCGIAAFKPSVGAVSGFGVTPFAPSFDTVGTLGGVIGDALALFAALAPPFLETGRSAEPQRLLLLDDPLYEKGEPEVLAAREDWARRFPGTQRIASPVPLASVLERNSVIVSHESGRIYKTLVATQFDLISPTLAKAFVEGATVTDAAYFEALRGLADLRRRFWAGIPAGSALILPPASHAAPEGFWTGDPTFASSMTVLGGPMAALPHGKMPDGRPLGVVLATPPGTDLGLAALLTRYEAQGLA